MERTRLLLRQPEFHVLVFFVCLFLFGWPVAITADLKKLEFMFVYLFVGWAIVIGLLFLISRSQDDTDTPE